MWASQRFWMTVKSSPMLHRRNSYSHRVVRTFQHHPRSTQTNHWTTQKKIGTVPISVSHVLKLVCMFSSSSPFRRCNCDGALSLFLQDQVILALASFPRSFHMGSSTEAMRSKVQLLNRSFFLFSLTPSLSFSECVAVTI